MCVTLADHGRSLTAMSLQPDAPATVREAGRIFARLFREICGADPLPEGDPAARCTVRFSDAALPGSRAEAEEAVLGEEGYALCLRDGVLTVSGSPVRGILYGVYAFFERFCGCRWFSDRDRLIPRRAVFAVPDDIDLWSVPDLRFRRYCNIEAKENEYCVANGINSSPVEIPPELGGQVKVALGLCHTIGHFIPDEMFDEHPEYFPLIGGKRVKGPNIQRCLSNPDVLAITVRKTRELLASDPEVKYVGISQADTYPDKDNTCECPACRAIEEAEGSKSGLWIRFLNAVSDALAPEFPEHGLETLAYRFTRKPPRTAPRPNIMITLCTIECCFSHKMDECDSQSSDTGGRSGNHLFMEDLRGWAKLCSNLLIWDYVTDFAHYMLPYPNLHTIGPNMRLFYANGVRGYYPEGAHDRFGSELGAMKGYLLSKLAWDRNYDIETGIKEFVGYYCGAGAPFVLDYIGSVTRRVEATGAHFRCYASPTPAFFDKAFLDYADLCFDRAEAVAENDEVLERIRYWRMSVRYARLTAGAGELGREAACAKLDRFLADMKHFGIRSKGEGGEFESSAEQIRKRIETCLEAQ